MSLIARLFFELIKSNFSVQTRINDELIAHFWVMPTDLDFNGHMNNNHYHTIMDYATIQLLGSHGILTAMLKNHWRPIVGCSLISHRRSLKVLDRYLVRSQVIYCDKHWSYLSHMIEYNGKVIAAANRKYALVNRNGLISTDKIFSAISQDYAHRPSSKQSIESWLEAEKTVLKQSQNEVIAKPVSIKPQVVECKKNSLSKMLKNSNGEATALPCLYSNLECAKRVGCSMTTDEQNYVKLSAPS